MRRARPTQRRDDPPDPASAELTQLIDIRDALAEARCLVTATWLACGSPILDRNTVAALSAVTHVARERLDDVLAALDALIALVSRRDG